MNKKLLSFIMLLCMVTTASGDSEVTVGGKTGAAHIIQEEGTSLRPRPYLNFTGSGATCTDAGGKTVCDITGGGAGGAGNSFVTWDTPSGTNIVAESTTDTVTFLEGAGITITGGGAADTLTITNTIDSLTDLSDVNTATADTGWVLVGNGANWDSVSMSGDVSITGPGVTTVDNDSHTHGQSTLTMALTGLSDVNSSTITAGNLLVANGVDFDSVALSGDGTLSGAGVFSINTADKTRTIHATITNPNDVDELTTLPIWRNKHGATFTISAIYSASDTDDASYTLDETDGVDWSSLTEISAVTIATNGTDVFYDDTTGLSATIEDGDWIVFDASTDDVNWISLDIIGQFP